VILTSTVVKCTVTCSRPGNSPDFIFVDVHNSDSNKRDAFAADTRHGERARRSVMMMSSTMTTMTTVAGDDDDDDDDDMKSLYASLTSILTASHRPCSTARRRDMLHSVGLQSRI